MMGRQIRAKVNEAHSAVSTTSPHSSSSSSSTVFECELGLTAMEVKVSVDGIPRVVCGVMEETTCQEVVLALAQALGQPGRYNLREKFKDFERCMTPDERLLETLERYGEQAKEVQLILYHNGPSTWEEMSRVKVGRYQACPPLRRKDAGGRMRRGSSSLSLHRQSLPPLSCAREVEQKHEELKRPKRKSLTFMEEAWEWLESLGKGRVYSTASDRESGKKADKKNRISLDVHLTADKDNSGRNSKGKARGEKNVKSDLDPQTSCCMANQTRSRENKHSKKTLEGTSEPCRFSGDVTEAEKNQLRETIVCQLMCLQNLQSQIARVDREICELENQRRWREEQEAVERAVEETELIQFWENELKAEEGYEKDLQSQFLEMKAKAVECKMKVEEYKCKIQGFDFSSGLSVTRDNSEMDSEDGKITGETSAVLPEDKNLHPPDLNKDVNRTFLPKEDFSPPHALVTPSQIKERRPTGPTELREWWRRWSEAHSAQPQGKKVVHRSELTVYLASTKV